MKKVLTAGLALAAAVAFGDSVVTNSSELSSQKLDTRVNDGARTISSVDEIWPFALADEGTIIVTADGYPQTAETLADRGDGTAVWAPLARATYTAVHASGQTAKFDLESTEGLPPNIFGYTVKCVPESFTYDGTVKEPSVTVSQGDDVLTPGEDYTVAFESGSHVGAYRAVVTGISGRGGILRGTYTIQPQPSALGGQKLDTRTDPVREANRFDDILPFVYIDGTTITVTRTNDGSTVEFVGAIDSTTNWVPSNFGFFAATNGSLSAAFRVNQFVCDFSFVGGTDEFDYQKGAEVKPAFTLRDGDYTLQEGTDYTAVYSNNINPGTATLTITGIGKYTAMGTVVKTFTIRPASVSDSSQAGTLDTRTGESRILNGVAELQAFAYNNVPGWPKGGDTGADAATVRMTPMIGVAGGVANWFPADVPETPATVAGENTLNWTPKDGFTCYKAEMLIGGELVETAYLNLNGADFEERATVTVIGGETMTVSVTTNDEQTLTGELTYRWYVYNPTNVWYEGFVTDAATFTPGPAHYEKAMRVLVFDDRGYAGMTETLWCSKLPVMYIDTDGVPVVSKDVDVAATMRLQGNARFTNKKQLYDGEMTMHVRGNTTGNAEKKPYKIKLDSKTNLLGLSVDSDGEASKNKHWVLLSNPYDFSLLRNKTAYDLSGEMGLAYMASEWVDVVMNGEYVGNYQLCEHIRVGEDRVDIYDWEGAADDVAGTIAETNGFTKAATKDLETYLEQNLGWVTAGEFTWTNGVTYKLADYGITNEFDISGGYLFELDMFADEVSMFYAGTSDGRLNILTKGNRPEYLKTNTEMLDAAKWAWSNYWNACVAPDGYYKGVHYTQMSSIDSMAAYLLTQEIMGQCDYQWSRYAFLPQSDLLQWGPAWDFDNACGGRSNWTFNPDGTIASRRDVRTGWMVATMSANTMFYREWIDDPYFVLKAVEKMNDMKGYLDDLLKEGGTIDENVDYIFESGVANADRWAGKITTSYLINSNMRFDGENGDVAWFRENLTSRIAWIRNEFRSIRAAVASLKTNNSKNPYTDSADKFAFDFVTPHVLRPVEGEGEGATPDIMLSNASNLETRVTLTGLTDPATVDVYVNGLSNGTYAVAGDAVEFTVNSNEFTNVGGHRNMISLVAKNASGTKLATTYSLVTTINEANYPQQISNATVVVAIDPEVQATGEPYEPKVTITVGEEPDVVTLVKDVDYKVEYLNNVNPGTATVRITGLGNPYGTGEFPRGNWVGTVSKTFVITAGIVSHDELTAQALDTRTDAVRQPASLDEILPVAWNNAADWPKDGRGDASVTVTFQQMTGDAASPTNWVAAGAPRTVVNASGEGTNGVKHLAAALYTATLTDGDAITNTAHFNLTATGASDPVADFEAQNLGKVTLDDTGDTLEIALIDTVDSPWTLTGGLGAVTLDLGGQSLAGTNGVDGTVVTAGGEGGAAIYVADGTTLTTVRNGSLTGGKGGDGNPLAKGAAAVAKADGTPLAVTAGEGATVTSGEDGADLRPAEQRALAEAFEGVGVVTIDVQDDQTNYVVTVTNSHEGTIEVPADVGSFSIDLAGQTLAGTNGVNGSATVPGTDGAPALVIGEGTTLTTVDNGTVRGGNGGDGNPPAKGAFAIVDATGAKLTPGGTATVTDGTDGADLKTDEQKELEEAFKPNAVVTPVTNDVGEVTNYNVTVTNDITGPVIVPETIGAFIIDLDGHSITGKVGAAGSAATAGGDGTAAIVVSNAAAQVSVKGLGSITGGAGGDGNPPAEGAEAIVSASGAKVDPVAVTDGATVSKGATGADLKTEDQKELEEAFKPNAVVTPLTDDDGNVTNYNVTVTNDITGPVAIPESVENLILDLNGKTVSGTNGVNGTATTPGTDGAPALTVGTGTTLVVKDSEGSGKIVGGNGGDGSVAGRGAKAIAGEYTTDGDVTVIDGEDGSVIKSEDQTKLEDAFDGIAEVEALLDEAGSPTNYVVTVTNGNEGTVEIPADIDLPVTLDLAGQTLAGTNGVNGTETTPGTDGAPAITVGTGTTLVVKDSGDPKGAVKGGNGGDGSVAGQGAKAIDGEYVTDGSAMITDGEGGQTLAKTPEQKALEEAFKPNAYVEPMKDDGGNVTNYNVVVTNDITGPVVVPENVEEFVISLGGHVITGAAGAAGDSETVGGDGTAAIVVSNAAAKVSVVGPGSITGGNGGAGNPPGEGAEAIVTSAGAKVEPVVVTDATVSKGAKGEHVRPCSVEIDKVLPRTPWSGDIEVRYTCTDLRAGFSYKEIFHVTVNGVEKCVTNAVPVLDVGYASLSKSFVIHGEELFGLNVKDSKAKVNIELVPVAELE